VLGQTPYAVGRPVVVQAGGGGAAGGWRWEPALVIFVGEALEPRSWRVGGGVNGAVPRAGEHLLDHGDDGVT